MTTFNGHIYYVLKSLFMLYLLNLRLYILKLLFYQVNSLKAWIPKQVPQLEFWQPEKVRLQWCVFR